jgi:signal peptidase I
MASIRQIPGWVRIAVIGRNPKVTIARIVIVVVACVIVFKVVLLPIRVEGISMLPTYKDGAVNFVNRLAYLRHGPQRGDVVSIRLGRTSVPYRAPSIMYLKRIIGLPGETVAFANGHLLINGATFNEPYMKDQCDWNSAPVTVGTGQYFAVGDNRSMPQEYHYHGLVVKEQIVGKVLF